MGYVLAPKANQETLYADVVDPFAHARAGPIDEPVVDESRTSGKGHGRLETGRYRGIPDADALAWQQDGPRWPGLRAIGMAEAERRIGEERTRERRDDLLGAPLTAAFGNAVCSPL